MGQFESELVRHMICPRPRTTQALLFLYSVPAVAETPEFQSFDRLVSHWLCVCADCVAVFYDAMVTEFGQLENGVIMYCRQEVPFIFILHLWCLDLIWSQNAVSVRCFGQLIIPVQIGVNPKRIGVVRLPPCPDCVMPMRSDWLPGGSAGPIHTRVVCCVPRPHPRQDMRPPDRRIRLCMPCIAITMHGRAGIADSVRSA
jgi:hypothetical protein